MPITVTPVPITNLGAATLPLVGDELVPLVQSGTTKQVAVSDLIGGTPGAITWTGVVTAVLVAGDNDNLAPDLTVASRLAVTLTGDANLTGLAGGSDGKVLMVQNRDIVDTLTIPNESATSSAANRFAINGDLIVPPRCGALFIYDGSIQRWVKS
jgi:hypothetical protein